MQKSIKFFVVPVLFSVLVLSFAGCDSGGSSNDTDIGILSGRVQDVVEASIDIDRINKDDATFFSRLKNFFTFSSQAIAQQDGITVNVIQGGAIIDTTTTDDDGNFTVQGAGDVILQFITPGGTTVELGINIPVGTVTTLTVTINENTETATINEFENGIRCETGDVSINDDEVTIDGNGTDDCIRTEGNCLVNINADIVNLENCERCIDSNGTSEINITADTINCDGIEEGIRSRGNSTVNLNAGECVIEGGTDEQGASSIDLSNCDIVTDDGTEDGTDDGTEDGTDDGTEDGTDDGTEDGTEDGTDAPV